LGDDLDRGLLLQTQDLDCAAGQPESAQLAHGDRRLTEEFQQ